MQNIKHRYSFLSLLFITVGCTTSAVGDYSYYLDAVQRVVSPGSFSGSPFVFMTSGRVFQKRKNELGSALIGLPVSSLENGLNFDAAVGLFRAQGTNGLSDPNQIPIGRMAFELNNAPTTVGSAILSKDTLAWLPLGSAIGLDYSYGKSDPNFYESLDSISFSYVDFNGETEKDTMNIAPEFGKITFPDTVSLSHDWTITYQHPVPNDSIEIYVDMFDTSVAITKPDTGSIVFAPNQLPLSNSSFSEFAIYLYRWNWSIQTTPSGKKIGIYSSMETAGQFIPTKP